MRSRQLLPIGLAFVLALVITACRASAPVALPSDGAAPNVVLVAYLGALVRGDCTTARALSTSEFVKTDPWCLAPHVTSFSLPGLGYNGDTEVGYSAQITTERSGEPFRDGEHTFFYQLRRDPGGPWRLAGAGTGP